MLAHAIERLAPQVGTLILNANGDPARFRDFGLPVVADTVPGYAGPLAGILAGMRWAASRAADGLVATAAADTPFFPADLVARLSAALPGACGVAVARSAGRVHPVFGLFPVALADDLERFIRRGVSLRVSDWLVAQEAAAVDFDGPGPDPFFNVNTPHDLVEAERRAGSGSTAADRRRRLG